MFNRLQWARQKSPQILNGIADQEAGHEDDGDDGGDDDGNDDGDDDADL